MLNRIMIGLAVLLGAGAIANGLFMLIAPADWYLAVPGVTDTGSFNQHFIRDIGLIFILLGGAFLLGAIRIEIRALLWGAAAVWLTGHALFHIWEVVVGICAPTALLRDFPAVSLPAVLAWILTAWARRYGFASSARL